MQRDAKILVLSGTREGVELIQRLQEKKVDVTASVAGDARTRVTFTAPVHFGGFATQADFAEFVGKNETTHVLDASHPNDPQISVQTQRWCSALDVKFLNITRSGWRAVAGDRWHTVAREADVAQVIRNPARVFLATGRMRLSEFFIVIYIVVKLMLPLMPFPFQMVNTCWAIPLLVSRMRWRFLNV